MDPKSPANTGSTVDTAASTAHSAVDRAAAAAKPAVARAAEYAHQAVDKATSAAGPAAQWFNDQSQGLKETQEKLLEDTSKYVAENPVKALAIAFVAGVIISRIVL